MPAPPKLGDAFGNIGIVEIPGESEAEDPSQPHRHIAVTGKVKVDMQGKGDGIEPVKQHTFLPGVPENAAQLPKGIGDEHLFAQADEKMECAGGHILPAFLPVLQLPGDVHIADNGAGDELGKQGNIGTEIDDISLGFGVPPVHIHRIADGLKGIKADANGQRQLQKGDAHAGEGIEVLQGKVGILKYRQRRQAAAYRQSEPQFFRSALAFFDGNAQGIKYGDGSRHQQHIPGLAPGIEEEAGQQQEAVSQTPGQQEIHQQHHRKIVKQKGNTRKEHCVTSSCKAGSPAGIVQISACRAVG